MKVLHSICQQIWNTQQWPQGLKRSVFIPIPRKGKAKECSNYHTIALISHAKDRNGMDLTEAENIKKRWQEYTEEPYKKDLHDPENYEGVITHLEPDILE